MSFAVSAEAYAAFMGRFSEPLAPPFADLPASRRASARSTSAPVPAR
jgi:hypothetical protein